MQQEEKISIVSPFYQNHQGFLLNHTKDNLKMIMNMVHFVKNLILFSKCLHI